ncbi:type IV pili methyl-accepting chemotaxis transducer N-terminal domain-containing protein [Thiomonas sp. X19]|uniref:type IV pili methyl-accepting chemotaxis transducer N-terminal domain-containing protein n=1 Tax=Thiomonas sp. X19 TaxID=1050370 RepID=UPI001E40D7FF|nr:type IV pili methyl-accepting chemotaxis transducer N-terminal domain-containing protein [Thiomonas sp. X19]
MTNKIAMFAGAFLLLSLLSVGATLWISWNLEGGAAAMNVAGRLRMMTYRLALTSDAPGQAALPVEVEQMQRSLDLLRRGNQARPLFVPWDGTIRERFAIVQTEWQKLRPRWLDARLGPQIPRAEIDHFVGQIDAFVNAIEQRLEFWTTVLHGFQMAMAALVVLGSMLMFYAAYLFVLDPVGRLSRGVQVLKEGDYTVRVHVNSTDELGDLAIGFNRMAEQLQTVYAELEGRVQQKTAALQTEQQRLAALYEISALVSRAQSLDELANAFTAAMQRIAGSDAALLRWTDETAQRYLLLAAHSMPAEITESERCLIAGTCHCGQTRANQGAQMVQFRRPGGIDQVGAADGACMREGFATLVSIPVAAQHRLLGEINLFYRSPHHIDPQQSALFDALAGHLAAAMESLRSAALEREAAVAQERALLARELHDSIAQALAFMKIQLQLLRSALKSNNTKRIGTAVNELDAGVRESLADVRELLLHFRTRTQEQDIEPALRSTLQKFELQSGVPVTLQFNGHGQPLDPDVQVQVLHVLQEALSNVRKHARAHAVTVEVSSLRRWRFEIRDDGQGFDPGKGTADAQAHVGLQIMRERAANIGADLRIDTAPGTGTRVLLELPEAVSIATDRGQARSAHAA